MLHIDGWKRPGTRNKMLALECQSIIFNGTIIPSKRVSQIIKTGVIGKCKLRNHWRIVVRQDKTSKEWSVVL
jgi:hypothetical protein